MKGNYKGVIVPELNDEQPAMVVSILEHPEFGLGTEVQFVRHLPSSREGLLLSANLLSIAANTLRDDLEELADKLELPPWPDEGEDDA